MRLIKRVDDLEDELNNMRKEAQEREIKRLRWGVSVLGTTVLVLGGWAYSQISHLITLRIGE